jgi:hypothetical protein
MTLGMVIVNKGNNKITELRTITVNKTMSSLYDNIHVFVIVSKPMSLLPDYQGPHLLLHGTG